VVDGRGVQPGRERRDERGTDCEREQGDEHARGLRPEALVTVTQSSAQEGCAEDKKESPQHRADQGGLDNSGETGAERENGYEQFGQIADARLQQTCRAWAQAFADLLDRPSHQRREERQSASGDYETGDIRGARSGHNPGRGREEARTGDCQALRSPKGVGSAGHVVDLRRRYSDLSLDVVQ
jgi:hypothetical protein